MIRKSFRRNDCAVAHTVFLFVSELLLEWLSRYYYDLWGWKIGKSEEGLLFLRPGIQLEARNVLHSPWSPHSLFNIHNYVFLICVKSQNIQCTRSAIVTMLHIMRALPRWYLVKPYFLLFFEKPYCSYEHTRIYNEMGWAATHMIRGHDTRFSVRIH